MGVQGLKTYIERQSNILKQHHFMNSKLVIDGSNLSYMLYFSSDLDQAHGGDYDGFETLLRDFFTSLKVCEIKPYVVIDGGTDHTDKKFDMLQSRAEEKIKKADALSRGNSRVQVLPTLIKNVFKQVLRKLEVPFIQCLQEADWEAAALASEWNCPILSDDSDFYIFNLRGGFLPISQFEWRKVVSQKQTKFIPAKLFHVRNLCAAYNMNPELLPIFATILGNDYTNLNKQLISIISQRGTFSGDKYTRFNRLLMRLSGFLSQEEAIHALASLIENKTDSLAVSTALKKGIKEYQLSTSSIAQYFKTGEPQNNLSEPLKRLPEWTLKPLAEGKLSFIIIDVVVMQRLTLNFPVENFELPSSNLTSRLIRKVIYGLSLCGGPGQRPSAAGLEQCVVVEYDREGLSLTSTSVLPKEVGPNLYLETLNKAPLHLRLQTLLDTLHVSQSPECLQVPDNLQLPVYVTCYWMKMAEPKPKPEFLKALLVGMVYGEMSRVGAEREVSPLLQRLVKDQRGLRLDVAHAFSQWQCCLRDSLCLSQMLCNPVPEPECAWLYNGTLVHWVVGELRKGHTPQTLLARSRRALELFNQLHLAMERELGPGFLERSNESEKDLSRMFQRLEF